MFQIQGKLVYYSDYCVAYLKDGREFANYYRSLLPKAWEVQPQKYPAHVTVVRKAKEVAPSDSKFWRKYEGINIPVYYEPVIRTGGSYFWIDAYSPSLNAIRTELGLDPYRTGWNNFHITIGNNKS